MILTNTNYYLAVSRFPNARKDAVADNVLYGTPYPNADQHYTFETLLQTFQEVDLSEKYEAFYSLSLWDGAHNDNDHHSATAIYLEYSKDVAGQVAQRLQNMGKAFYTIPTRAVDVSYKPDGKTTRKSVDCVGFIFPCHIGEDISQVDTIRIASLVAHKINIRGLSGGSHMPTYLFRWRDGAIQFHDGDFLDAKFASDRTFTTTNSYVR